MTMANRRRIVVSALAVTLLATLMAIMTRWEPTDTGCDGEHCKLACDEDRLGVAACPHPLACVGDRCEARADACSEDAPVEACACSPPWVVSEGRCHDPFANRVCAEPGLIRAAELFEETCEASPSRCSQLLKLDGDRLRGLLEVAPVRSTQPWDSTIAGLPRVDRWLAEHERTSLYGGEPLVVVVAALSPIPRPQRRRGVPSRSISEALDAVVDASTRDRLITITIPPGGGEGSRALEFPPGSVTILAFPCLTKDAAQ